MKEFFHYILCSLLGRPLRHQYIIEQTDWKKVQDNFKFLDSQLTADDNMKVAISDCEITIQEYYWSGIYYKGSSKSVNNEARTTIKSASGKLIVTIDIRRAIESRLMTNISIILAPVSGIRYVYDLYTWFNGNTRSAPLAYMAFSLFLALLVVVFWQLSRTKYKQVRKGITDIIVQ